VSKPSVETSHAPRVDRRSLLLITLDSCCYDTFVAAEAPNLKAIGQGEIHRAQAPSHFTYASHMAMWVGVTPGVPGAAAPYLDTKFAKIFRISNGARRAYGPSAFELEGANIVVGFGMGGYRTIGCGALGWFNPTTPAGAVVTADFERVFHVGWPWSVERQLAWLEAELDTAPADQPVFVFLNVGETHAPYWFEGAPWSADDNPCVPFQTVDRRAECAERQRACLEYVDAKLAPLLARFAGASVVATADHGDCWGEDGLWEHGVSHAATLTVPLVFRVEAEVDRARTLLHAAEAAMALAARAPNETADCGSASPLELIALDTVVRLRPGLICTDVDEEVVIVDTASGEFHAAGVTGSSVVRLLDDGAPVADIVAALMRMYDIDRQTCVDEVLSFLRMLDEKKLLSNGLRATPRMA